MKKGNFSKTSTFVKSSIETKQVNQSTIESRICTPTPDPTLSCLITAIAKDNSQVALILATAIAISVVIYAVSKSAAEIIKVLRREED